MQLANFDLYQPHCGQGHSEGRRNMVKTWIQIPAWSHHLCDLGQMSELDSSQFSLGATGGVK